MPNMRMRLQLCGDIARADEIVETLRRMSDVHRVVKVQLSVPPASEVSGLVRSQAGDSSGSVRTLDVRLAAPVAWDFVRDRIQTLATRGDLVVEWLDGDA